MRDNQVPCLLVMAMSLVALTLQGCGKDPARDTRNKASAALDRVLDAWARGESPDKCAAGQPIQLVDPDWKAGYRLVSFLTDETAPTDGKPDEWVRCRVALALKDRKGRTMEKKVVYLVKMGDPIVISREGRL